MRIEDFTLNKKTRPLSPLYGRREAGHVLEQVYSVAGRSCASFGAVAAITDEAFPGAVETQFGDKMNVMFWQAITLATEGKILAAGQVWPKTIASDLHRILADADGRGLLEEDDADFNPRHLAYAIGRGKRFFAVDLRRWTNPRTHGNWLYLVCKRPDGLTVIILAGR